MNLMFPVVVKKAKRKIKMSVDLSCNAPLSALPFEIECIKIVTLESVIWSYAGVNKFDTFLGIYHGHWIQIWRKETK